MKIPIKQFLNWIREQLFATRKTVKTAVFIVQKLKAAVDSGIVRTLIELTPTDKDDLAVAKLRVILTEALIILNMANSWDSERAIIDAQVKLSHIKRSDRKLYWKALAGQIIHQSDKSIPLDTAIAMGQEEYKEQIKLEAGI